MTKTYEIKVTVTSPMDEADVVEQIQSLSSDVLEIVEIEALETTGQDVWAFETEGARESMNERMARMNERLENRRRRLGQ